MYTAQSHDRYARAFVHQRVAEVFNLLDSKHDGELDESELQSHLCSVGYRASKREVHDMIWEVDDKSTGVIKLEAIRKLLQRLQKAKKRMPGTGTNLLRTLIEFMMFDSDASAAIELEEIQQMFYVYYGYKGRELDEKVRDFSRMRAADKEGQEIDFSEFLTLMDNLGLVPVVGEQESTKAPRPPCIPRLRRGARSPRESSSPPQSFRGIRGGKTPRLPSIKSPRQRPTERQMSEMKFRKISNRFENDAARERHRRFLDEQSKQDEPGGMLTIRNALMK